MSDASQRRPWTEGPDEEAPPESWLLLGDDALLHRIQTKDASANEDDRLLEVVESDRHFFIRQEAAKRVSDRKRLFVIEDDRHIGQILVRHLTRREDVSSVVVAVREVALDGDRVSVRAQWERTIARRNGGPQILEGQTTFHFLRSATSLRLLDFRGDAPFGIEGIPALP